MIVGEPVIHDGRYMTCHAYKIYCKRTEAVSPFADYRNYISRLLNRYGMSMSSPTPINRTNSLGFLWSQS